MDLDKFQRYLEDELANIKVHLKYYSAQESMIEQILNTFNTMIKEQDESNDQ